MSKTLTLPQGLERRFLRAELRADNTDGQKKVRGYAAVFNSLSEDLGGFKERLSPGCFAESLRSRPDVFLLNSHDTASVLARVSNATLTVREDGRGLRFTALLPDTTLGADSFENIRSGLLSSMSFGMVVTGDEWSEGSSEDGARISIRTVKSAKLFEISCVAFPAYSSSSVGARSLALFPVGVPQEIRSRLALRAADDDEDPDEPCDCDCENCKEDDCVNCTNEECNDENCRACPFAERSLRKLQEIRSVDAATAKKLQHHGRSITRIIDGLPEADRANVWQAVMHQAAEKFGVASGYYAGDDEDDEDRDLRRRARLLGHGLTI